LVYFMFKILQEFSSQDCELFNLLKSPTKPSKSAVLKLIQNEPSTLFYRYDHIIAPITLSHFRNSDRRGQTPLHLVCSLGGDTKDSLEMVVINIYLLLIHQAQSMIKKGANINSVDIDKWTPLHWY
jgi:hypothetical protein